MHSLPVHDDPTFGAFLPGVPVTFGATGSGTLDRLGFAVKDLIDVRGHATGGGNPDWLAAQTPAENHAPVVTELLGAGAHVMGKTVTDELAFSLEGANAHYGTPLNPRNRQWLPGGSSSGSAVAVAAGIADFALGTDTGGSVRVPAAFCGIYGFRPSHGTISLDGVLPFAPSYDTIGWFARDAQTLQKVGDVLLPPLDPAPIVRVCTIADLKDAVPTDVVGDMMQAANRIATHAPVDLFEEINLQDVSAAYTTVQCYEIKFALGARLARINPRFASDIADRFAGALVTNESAYNAACAYRAGLCVRLAEICSPDMALIIPSVSQRHLEKNASAEAIKQFYKTTLALTALAGHWGAPQVQLGVPVGDQRVGMSLLGAPGSDLALLDLAASLSLRLEEVL